VIAAGYGLTFDELQSLLSTLEDEDQRRAIESDLIDKGLRLRWVGSDVLTWYELYAVLVNLGFGSALHRLQHGEDAKWDNLDRMLLADIVDGLNVGNWQRSNPRSKRDYPKPIPRPGVVDQDTEKFGGKPVSLEEMDALLGWSLN
jgi:hypothetical protein